MDFEEEMKQHNPRCFRIRQESLVMAMSFFNTFVMCASEHLVETSMEFFLKERDVPDMTGDPYECNVTNTSFTRVPQNQILYDWDDVVRTSINKWSMLGYLCTQAIAGVYADKYGVRRLGLIANSASASLIILCPLIIKNCQGKYQFLQAWSFVFGVVRGPALPMVDAFMGQWVSFGKRTTAVCLADIGVLLGLSFTGIFGRIFMRTFDWSASFYLISTMQITFCIFWYFLCFSSPDTHPTITDEEKVHLREKLGPYLGFKNKTIPWKDMLNCFQLWTVFINYGVSFYAGWMMIHQARIFFATTQKIHLDLCPPSMICASLVNLLFSILSDYLIRKNLIELSTLRKVYAYFGSMGAGIFLVATTYTSCIQKLTIVLYAITIIFGGMYFTAAHAPMQDIAPNFSGTIRGFGNTFAFFLVVVSPSILKPFFKKHYLMNWRSVFWFSLIFYTSANLIFALSYKGKEQDWNIPRHLRRKYVSGSSSHTDEQKIE